MIEFFPSRTVAVEIGGFGIHWYGLLYFAAFMLAAWLLPRLQKHRGLSLTQDEWSSILMWGVVGVIVGGRLGYVLFYQPSYYLSHLFEVIAVWNGGMSSHGGFIGVVLAMFWALRKYSWPEKWKIADTIVVPIAIGLALGRLGNFINQELYGTVTSLPWGISVPGIEGLRHPTQIYAIIKDLGIAFVCYLFLRSSKPKNGQVVAVFLMLYGLLRFVVEIFRDQTGVSMFGPLSEGQVLTIPVFIIGLMLWVRTRK
jgi:phosphatidylglycerol---prolipoprotein diacylglyceryl transferase